LSYKPKGDLIDKILCICSNYIIINEYEGSIIVHVVHICDLNNSLSQNNNKLFKFFGPKISSIACYKSL